MLTPLHFSSIFKVFSKAVIHLVSSKLDRSSVFKVQDIQVKVNALKFAVRDSKHDFLYKTLRPLASNLIKRQIQKAFKDALITAFEYIDGQLVAVRDRVESAQATEGDSRADVLKDVSLISFFFQSYFIKHSF